MSEKDSLRPIKLVDEGFNPDLDAREVVNAMIEKATSEPVSGVETERETLADVIHLNTGYVPDAGDVVIETVVGKDMLNPQLNKNALRSLADRKTYRGIYGVIKDIFTGDDIF